MLTSQILPLPPQTAYIIARILQEAIQATDFLVTTTIILKPALQQAITAQVAPLTIAGTPTATTTPGLLLWPILPTTRPLPILLVLNLPVLLSAPPTGPCLPVVLLLKISVPFLEAMMEVEKNNQVALGVAVLEPSPIISFTPATSRARPRSVAARSATIGVGRRTASTTSILSA